MPPKTAIDAVLATVNRQAAANPNWIAPIVAPNTADAGPDAGADADTAAAKGGTSSIPLEKHPCFAALEPATATRLNCHDLDSGSLIGTIPPGVGDLTLPVGFLQPLRPLHVLNRSLIMPTDVPNRLTYFAVHGNELTGSIPAALGDLTLLEELVLYDNPFLAGRIPATWGKLTNLREIRMQHQSLTGTLAPELGALSRLTRWDLHEGQLSGTIPPELGKLTALAYWDLLLNHLSGSIPPELGSLTRLTHFRVPNNKLTGSIPHEVGKLSAMARLDFSDNKLSGQIPHELGGLTALTLLDLRKNALTGSIPPELGALTGLTWFAADANRLSGCVPCLAVCADGIEGHPCQVTQGGTNPRVAGRCTGACGRGSSAGGGTAARAPAAAAGSGDVPHLLATITLLQNRVAQLEGMVANQGAGGDVDFAQSLAIALVGIVVIVAIVLGRAKQKTPKQKKRYVVEKDGEDEQLLGGKEV